MRTIRILFCVGLVAAAPAYAQDAAPTCGRHLNTARPSPGQATSDPRAPIAGSHTRAVATGRVV